MSRKKATAPFDAAEWIAAHPVFTVADFAEAHGRGRKRSHVSALSLLRYHLGKNGLRQVHRGRYTTTTDPYVLASHLAPDAAVAYLSAFAVHDLVDDEGLVTWTSRQRTPKRFSDRPSGATFIPAWIPEALQRRADDGFGVQTLLRDGQPVRVTTMERTFVDVLDRPRLGPELPTLWRFWLEHGRTLDHDAMVRHTLRLDSAITALRVGFFLSTHPEFRPTTRHVEALQRFRPATPVPWDRSDRDPAAALEPRRKRGEPTYSYDQPWNLLLPRFLVERRAESR
ncbi:MAG: hypothetical protein K1X89_02320 [Myxococcaceae bacterium]|nr:hypothetical protein [Myxococcaceae bacterium]